ncbi:MAG: RecX family transcriptional regulator [Erysipelotrichaceae bacterium]|nr:RecX family transcriptional regulator [Erysipelotrichaceae bacterium]
MKIGLFTDTFTPEINGVVSSIVTLRHELEKQGHTVYVITTHPNLLEVQYKDNVLRLPGIELKKLYGYVMSSPIHFTCLNTIKKMELDLIHAHTEFGIGIFARIVSRYLSIPLVSTYHTTYEDYTHYVNVFHLDSIEKAAKKAVSTLSKMYGDSSVEVISPSEKTKEMLLGYGIKRNIHVIPTGLDVERFDQDKKDPARIAQIKEEFGFLPEDTIVLFVGRIAKEKAIDLVIDGFGEIKLQGRNDIHFLIVGDGPQRTELEEKTSMMQLNDLVHFAGKKTPAEVPHYYHTADVFVSASTTETQGLTFIEALASKLPVFARPDDVLTDLVIEDETGYLFNDAKEFAKKMIAYVDSSDEHKERIVENTLERVEPYDGRVFYQRIMNVYESAIRTYAGYYHITMIKSKDDYVELNLEGTQKDLKVLMSIDNYMSMNLRLNSVITPEQLQEIQSMEAEVKVYQAALRKLAVKDRTRKEMYDWLTNETECSIEVINNIIERLEERGYIDDVKYARSAVTSMKASLMGERRIFKNLKSKGISVETIDEVIAELAEEDEETANAIRYAQKIQRQIKDKSLRKTKMLIAQKLYSQGYSQENAQRALNTLDFEDEIQDERKILKELAQKAKIRYEKKYTGVELRNRVFRYCSSQGFEMDDIYLVLSEMEWENER